MARLLAMPQSPQRLQIYDLSINGRIPNPPWGGNQLNQLLNYTAPDVNMLLCKGFSIYSSLAFAIIRALLIA